MSDDPKTDAGPASGPAPTPADPPPPASAPAESQGNAGTATTTAPPPPVEASPRPERKEPPATRSVDWSALAPSTGAEIVLDVVKVAVFALVIMNGWAVAHGCSVTTKIAIAGIVGGLAVTAAWKAFLALAEAKGARVVGAAYAVLGVACCAGVLWYASSGETVTTSRQLRIVLQLLGLAFLYPAGLGLFAALKGEDVQAINPLGFPMTPRWFATLWVLFAKEVRSFFTTGMPYVIIFVFTAMNGFLMWLLIPYYQRAGMGEVAKPGEILSTNFFTMLALWIIWPAITMRLIAEEKRMGTIETLLTVPVTDVQVVLAKFLAAMAFYAINLVPFLAYHVVLAQYARDWDWGPIFGEFLGLLLWGGLAMSLGLFYSALTESQLVAFLLGAVTNLILYILSSAEGFIKEDTVLLGFVHLKKVVGYLSVHHHYNEMSKGIISSQALVFFLSITALGLFASVRGVEAQRWK